MLSDQVQFTKLCCKYYGIYVKIDERVDKE